VIIRKNSSKKQLKRNKSHQSISEKIYKEMTTNETDRSKQAKSTDPIVSLKKAKKQKVKPVLKLRIPEVKPKPKPVKDK
jgi:hypothetical protein